MENKVLQLGSQLKMVAKNGGKGVGGAVEASASCLNFCYEKRESASAIVFCWSGM